MMSRADKILLAAALAALASVPAAAQSELNDAYKAARASAAAAKSSAESKPAAPASCPDAKALETTFEFTLAATDGGAPLRLRFEFAGCEDFERNDYLPAYTQRSYTANDGYGLTILVNDGSEQAEVLVSKGPNWVGKLEAFTVAQLASGDVLKDALADHEQWNKTRGKATIRNAAKPLYPQLKSCEAADWSKAALAAPARVDGKPALGFVGPGPSLVLLTKTAAYYYHEDCDICAEVTKCELSTGALSSAVAGHSVDCADMKKFSATDAVYDACADAR